MDKELEWRVFQLYLESLNLNASKIWVGYRYDALDYITKSCAPNFGNRIVCVWHTVDKFCDSAVVD